MTRPSKTEYFLGVAAFTATMSTCSRLQVGAVLTDLNGETFWVGYNGGPRGGLNRCRHDEEGACGCLHAELNALLKAPGGIDKIAYLTHSPCPMCAVALVNSHVVQVEFIEHYRNSEGLEILHEAGVGATGA